MESATVAANGFRYRVPNATLLCVSDKPLHGQPKLPGEAKRFYEESKHQHLAIAIDALEAARGDYDIVTWDLQPGDAYVFHALTVHGAGGNLRGDVRRRGYTVRYTGDDIRYDTRPGTNEHLRGGGYADGDRLRAPLYPEVWPR